MQKNTVTIKSIANALGVSFSTVSKALNGDPNISPKTRAMVEQKAQEMHYTKNYFAKSLRQNDSHTVALLFNDIDIPAYGEMIAQISGELADHGYTTIVSNANYSPEIERTCLENILSRIPDAIIIAPADPASENMELLQPHLDKTLVLGKVDESVETHTLTIRHDVSGFISADHMIGCGCKNPLIFGGPEKYQACDLFLKGVHDAFDKHGLAWDASSVFRFKPDRQKSYELFLQLWKEHPGKWDGVICFCDSMAFGVYNAARELGLSIPDDISVIGYDDGPVNDFTAPPLSTIHMPKDLLATYCSQFVLDLLVAGNTQKHVYELEPYLSDRESVRKNPT